LCQAGESPAADLLRAQLDDDWRYWMVQYPQVATVVGYPGQNARLDFHNDAMPIRGIVPHNLRMPNEPD
jgi:hypothetical protein